MSIAHGGMNPRAVKSEMPKKELDHIRVSEAENSGHIAEHHNTAFEHPPEQHVFAAPAGKHPVMEGHLFHHLAQHLGIPHEVVKEEATEKPEQEKAEMAEDGEGEEE